MSDEVSEGISAWLIVTGLIILSAIAFAMVYWGVRPLIMEREREQNKESQQYQDAKIAEARANVTGIQNAGSADQKQHLVDQFCPKFTEIKSPPPDLVKANTEYCG